MKQTITMEPGSGMAVAVQRVGKSKNILEAPIGRVDVITNERGVLSIRAEVEGDDGFSLKFELPVHTIKEFIVAFQQLDKSLTGKGA